MPTATARALALVCLVVPTACSLPHWPVEGPMGAPFGVRWNGVVPGIHRGVDILVPTGTPIRAMAGGNVRFAGTMRDFGLVVWLEHPDEVLTVYAHLSEIRVETGQAIPRGGLVGLSGSSGNASGPHLHFEIWRRGVQVDPVAMLGGPPGP